MDKIRDIAEKRTVAVMKERDELFSKLGSDLVSPHFRTVRQVYIDLFCLRDLRMGTLLHKYPDKKDYLLEQLDKYNQRPVRHFKYAYPDLPDEESDLIEHLFKKENHEDIFNLSPSTDLYNSFPALVNQILESNSRTGYIGKVKIYLNRYPLCSGPLVDLYEKFLFNYFREKFDFIFIEVPYNKLPESILRNTQMFFLDDLAKLCTYGSLFYRMLIEEEALTNTRIFTAPTISEEIYEKWKSTEPRKLDSDALRYIFDINEMSLSLAAEIRFVPFKIPNNTKKEEVTNG